MARSRKFRSRQQRVESANHQDRSCATGPATARRIGIEPFPCFDILELFAFVRPAEFCVPTPRGLAEALDMAQPDDLADQAMSIRNAATSLLREAAERLTDRHDLATAQAMARGGWRWGPAILAALGGDVEEGTRPGAGLDVWRQLPEWQERAPPPPPGELPVKPAESRARLATLLGEASESRPSQSDYASSVTHAFNPRDEVDTPNFVLAEAGTGVGKTLGYIAPSSLWASRNEAPVWISTYTRNLQQQIDGELDRLFPDPDVKRNRVVVRKGRENYLCLLNFEEAVRGVAVRGGDAIALGLMARWAARTRSGDTSGGDFPAWLPDILGRRATSGLTDRRGECIYSACSHYSKCFIERNIRKARCADLVIANHALVMIQAARGMPDQGNRPTRFVFDEGHHVFDAADSAFSAHLTGLGRRRITTLVARRRIPTKHPVPRLEKPGSKGFQVMTRRQNGYWRKLILRRRHFQRKVGETGSPKGSPRARQNRFYAPPGTSSTRVSSIRTAPSIWKSARLNRRKNCWPQRLN